MNLILGALEVGTNPKAIPQFDKWQAVLKHDLSGRLPLLEDDVAAIQQVHAYVNEAIGYRPEPGGADEWHVLPRYGDCEDFAVSKYLMLEKRLTPRNLRVVIGVLPYGAGHAICLAKANNAWHVLDNMKVKVYPTAPDFKPMFGLTRGAQFIYLNARPIR